MKIRSVAGGFATCVAAVCAAVAVSAAVKEPGNAKCPVSGHACDPAASAEFAGGKVWFCCDKCQDAFRQDVASFAAKAHQQMVVTGQLVQKGCPFSGGPMKAGTQLAIGDAEVGFCCNTCKGKVEKATPDERVTMVFGKIDKGFALAK
jgi:hypothetical protein